MPVKFLLLLLFPLCLACNHADDSETTNTSIEFDETKWKTKKALDYPYRDSMLTDLMSNEQIRELKRDEILDLLGEPTRVDGNYLFYMVTQKRLNFWPLHTKSLVIQLDQDSTINWMKIHE